MQMINLVLFVAEACIYFTVMVCLLHYRQRLGLGVFLTALGVMHFMETYLAAVFYVSLPFGIASPGSSVFFAGKLMMILLLYLKEDAATVRQPIYGLFLGNLLTVAIALVVQLHSTVELSPGQAADIGFLREIGWLMLWGTTLLYLDAIGIILLYERLGRALQRFVVLRFLICGLIMLTFDQIGFFGALHLFFGAPVEVFWDGWKAKMLATLIFTVLFAAYQHLGRARAVTTAWRPLADVFNDLTFRERYEKLLETTGRDMLTGVLDRGRMEQFGTKLVEDGVKGGTPVSVLIADADHFKQVNDSFGHLKGDEVLKGIAAILQKNLRAQDLLFRFGGEEFVIVAPATDQADAMRLAERMRLAIAASVTTPAGGITISLGVATAPQDGYSLNSALTVADERLYQAKSAGRNRAVGRPEQD